MVVLLGIAYAQELPECRPNEVYYLPHPTECNKFIHCLYGFVIEMTCHGEALWNNDYQKCDYPENVVCP